MGTTPKLATIELINRSTVLDDAAVAAWVTGLQRQITEDFYPIWGRDARVIFTGREGRPHAGTWWAVVTDDADQAGVLGYHDVTNAGDPLLHIFAATALRFGLSPTVTASHEILESLADAGIDKCIQIGATFYAYEICDPCELDSFGYEKAGILVSDFVTPAWFDGQVGDVCDFGRHIGRPRELLAGGYISVFRNGGWIQLEHATKAHAARRIAPRGARRERRLRAHTGVAFTKSAVKTR